MIMRTKVRLLSSTLSWVAGSAMFLISQTAGALTLTFDYSYDTSNFFSTQVRKDLLESAGSYFESRLTDDLLAITSAGSNSFNANFSRPDTGDTENLSSYNVAADTLVIFAGGRNLSGGTLGKGGPGGWSASGTPAFLDIAEKRGEGAATGGSSATEFAPWGGSVAFDSGSTSWYFDTDPSTSEPFSGNDFYSVALHELGHVLGIGTADSWDNLINSSDEFTGAAAVVSYGGNVPVTDDWSHWDYYTMSTVNGSPQEAAMDPNITTGTRKLFTELDNAGLDDIGWDVAPVPVPAAVYLLGSGLLALIGIGRRRRL